jgi:hypothetical protein
MTPERERELYLSIMFYFVEEKTEDGGGRMEALVHHAGNVVFC